MHVSPVIDAVGIKEIAANTSKAPIHNEFSELIKSTKNYSVKPTQFKSHRKILSKITCVSNGTLVKRYKIILLKTLFEKVIKLAAGGQNGLTKHPGQNSLIQRLKRFRKESC